MESFYDYEKCKVCQTRITDQLILTNLGVLICMECWAGDNCSAYSIAEIDKINEKVFLGNAEAQKKKDVLKTIGVTNILVIGKELKIFHPNDFVYHRIEIDDDEKADILKYFNETFDFIESSKGCVFVHCMAGISRSASIVIAYLMRKEGKNYEDARKFVKEKRCFISTNYGFVNQLKQFEESLKKEKMRAEQL